MPKRNKVHQKMINASKKRVELDKKEPERKQSRIFKGQLIKADNRRERKHRQKIIEDLRAILDGGKPKNTSCPHYLIGAASLRYLCTGRYNMYRAHQHLKAKEVPTGSETYSVGEKASEQNHDGAHRQRFRIHPFIPFLCSKSDIAYMQSTVEIKTSTRPEFVKTFDKKVPRHTLPQIWQTMECFAHPESRIEVYLFTTLDKASENQKRMLGRKSMGALKGFFHKSHEVVVLRKATLFDQETIEFIVERYLVFLKSYFRAGKLVVTESIKKEMHKMIMDEIAQRKRIFEKIGEDPVACDSYLADIASKLREEECGRICFRYGAENRKKPFNPEGSLIQVERNKEGFIKDTHNIKEWHRDNNHPCVRHVVELVDEDREVLVRSFKKSLDNYLKKEEEGAEGSLVLSPLSEIDYPTTIPAEIIENWKNTN